MLEFLLLIICFLVSILFLIKKLQSSKSKSKAQKLETFHGIPGPKNNDPELGNLVDMKKHGSYHQYMMFLHREYGPIVAYHMGKQLCFSVSTPFYIRQIRHLFNRAVIMFDQFRPMIGDHSMQYANDDLGRAMRRKLDQAFDAEQLRDVYAHVINRVVLHEIDRLTWNEIDGVSEATVNINELTMQLVSRSMYQNLFYETCDDAVIAKLFDSYNLVWDKLDQQLVDDGNINLSQDAHFQQCLQNVKDVMKSIVHDYRLKNTPGASQSENQEKVGSGGRSKFLDLLHEFYQNEPDREEAVLNNVMTYFIGGTHTSRTLVTFLLYYLAKYPEIQDRIVAELEEASKSCNLIDLALNSAVKLPYFQAVIDESLRISKAGGISARQTPYAHEPPLRIQLDEECPVFHEMLKEKKNKDECSVELPPNSPIIQSLSVISENPRLFPDPQEFKPERFLSPPNQKSGIVQHSFEPFGFAGKRKCPGYKFFYLECGIWTLQMLKRFELRFADPAKTDFNWVFTLVARMDRDIYLKLRYREKHA